MFNGKGLTAVIENREQNNFLLIRLVAASFVIFSHSFDLLGFQSHEWGSVWIGPQFRMSYLGLIAFFFLSGLLVSKSLAERRSFLNYLWKRLLRIFPAFWIVILFAGLLIGPLNANCALSEYFFSLDFWRYFKGFNIFTIQDDLPCVFKENIVSGVNGSLWTIPLEFKLYLGIFLLALFKVFNKWIILSLGMAMVIFASILHPILKEVLKDTPSLYKSLSVYLDFGTFFIVGSCCYFFRKKIVIHSLGVVLLFVIWWFTFEYPVRRLLDFVFFPYLIMYLASVRMDFRIRGDYSYGIYIYAFPIQQTLIHFWGDQLSPILLFGLSLICVAPFAYLSWHVIESRALKYKGWLA